MTGRRRTLRRISLTLLFGWLFAIATGVAQACLAPVLVERAEPGHCDAAAMVAAGEDAIGDHADAPPPPAGESACAKFCSDAASATKSFDRIAGDPTPVAPALPLPALPWRAAVDAVAARAAIDSTPRPGPSITIVLHRLVR